MENSLHKQEVVAMLMESPFYFDLRLRDRLALVQQHYRRFSESSDAGHSSPADNRRVGLIDGVKGDKVVTIIVGFRPSRTLTAESPRRLAASRGSDL